LLIKTVQRKRCATWERWCAEQRPVARQGAVAVAEESGSGLCTGGGWHGSERRARSTCGHWRVWAALATAVATSLR
jgi:hypothetical protein